MVLDQNTIVQQSEAAGRFHAGIGSAAWCVKTPVKLAIDGKPHKTALPNGMEATSVLRWEGSTLLSETTFEGGGGSFTFKDKITLSGNGKTMLIDRRIVSGAGEEPRKVVFERQ